MTGTRDPVHQDTPTEARIRALPAGERLWVLGWLLDSSEARERAVVAALDALETWWAYVARSAS